MNYSLISDVGETMIKLLRSELVPEPILEPSKINVCSPAKKADSQLSLYLYNIEEAGEYRKTKMISIDKDTKSYPPMALNFYYLITAYSGSQELTKSSDEHKILGKAMQVFYDNPTIKGSRLTGSLKGSQQEIKISFKNLTYDEMMRIWHFNDLPYVLSVAYKVGPVYLESTRIKTTTPVKTAIFGLEPTKGEK